MIDKKRVRTRFAPSPTGFLHIGGVRTALFSYLFAKGRGGDFILRIEDTDTERSNESYTQDIMKSLQWMGLNWDEGPIFQSQQFERYSEVCRQLVRSGHAYYCYCTPEELDLERKALESAEKKPMYGGRCRDLGHQTPDPARGPAVIRLRVPRTGEVSFEDQIRGLISFQCTEIEDFVCQRSNGSPTYNLSCVVDDADEQMSHVIRGDDHINNTPKQILIYRGLGVEPPLFAHLPMILGPDKKKLSKRHGAVSANQYRSDGYLPHAVINYLARLGWGHGDQEVFSREELLELFSLDKIGKSSAVFNTEKLNWLNGHYMRETPAQVLADILISDFLPELQKSDQNSRVQSQLTSAHGLELINLGKTKVKLLGELATLLSPLISDAQRITLDEAQAKSLWSLGKIGESFQQILRELDHLIPSGTATQEGLIDLGIDAKKVETLYRATAERYGLKLVELAQPTRFFLSGVTVGPSLFDVMVRMPWIVVRERLGRYSEVLV